MAIDALLSQIDPIGVKEVLKEIKQIMRVYFTLLREYERGQSDVTDLMKKFETVVKYANKKYKGLFFKILRRTDDLKLCIYLRNEKSIKAISCTKHGSKRLIFYALHVWNNRKTKRSSSWSSRNCPRIYYREMGFRHKRRRRVLVHSRPWMGYRNSIWNLRFMGKWRLFCYF